MQMRSVLWEAGNELLKIIRWTKRFKEFKTSNSFPVHSKRGGKSRFFFLVTSKSGAWTSRCSGLLTSSSSTHFVRPFLFRSTSFSPFCCLYIEASLGTLTLSSRSSTDVKHDLRLFAIYLGSSMQTLGYCLKTGHDRFLPRPSQITIHSQPIIGRYVPIQSKVIMTNAVQQNYVVLFADGLLGNWDVTSTNETAPIIWINKEMAEQVFISLTLLNNEVSVAERDTSFITWKGL